MNKRQIRFGSHRVRAGLVAFDVYGGGWYSGNYENDAVKQENGREHDPRHRATINFLFGRFHLMMKLM